MTELTLDERLRLTRRTMQLLEDWGLAARDIAGLLQLPETIKARHIGRFHDQDVFPDDPAVNRRVAYLNRIEQALHTYFRRAPVAVMIEDGESGLISVLSHLDCTFAWDLTGSRADYRRAS